MSSDIPSWLQSDNTGQMQALLARLPKLFSTKALTNRTNAAINTQIGMGQAMSSAAGRQYANRAAQVGASGMGAGFAMGQAMLPYFGQRNEMLSDLEKQKAIARQQQGQLSSDLAGRIGQLQAMRQSNISEYSTAQQRMQQEGDQFTASQSERSREFDVSAGMQQQGMNLDRMKLAMSMPRQRYQWNTNNAGTPIDANDRRQAQGYDNQQAYFANLRNSLNRAEQPSFF